MTQYQAHADFMPSLHNFYLKNGNYRKAANKVLAAWAKSQNQHIFTDPQVFQGFNLTNHGENRIQYCCKYDLYDASRLVTQQHAEVCTFLFVGTHQEVEEWLNKNRGFSLTYQKYKLAEQQETPSVVALPIQYSKTRLQELKNISTNLKIDIAQYEAYFKDTNISYKSHSDLTSESLKIMVNQLLNNNMTAFKNQLNTIKQLTQGRQTQKAIKQAEELELFTDFIKLKLKYIATLKKYLETSKNLH